MKDEKQKASGDVDIENQSEATSNPPKSNLPSNLQTKKTGSRSSEVSEPQIEAPPAEDHKADFSSLVSRITERVRSGVASPDTKDQKPKPKHKKTTRAQQNELQDAARILLTPLLIFAVGQSLGEVCEPSKDEADAFVDPMARIIARHVPIPEHLSADIIDLLAMSAAIVIWYGRVHPDLPKGGRDGRKPQPATDGRGPRAERRPKQKTKTTVAKPAGITIEELLDQPEVLGGR